MHKLRWKHIYQINPLMRNKKFTWLCLNSGCDCISGLTDKFYCTASQLFDDSEMPEPKSVIRMISPGSVSHIPRLYVCMLWDIIYDVQKKKKEPDKKFAQIFCTNFTGNYKFGTKMLLYSQMIHDIFQFWAHVRQLWMETAIVRDLISFNSTNTFLCWCS